MRVSVVCFKCFLSFCARCASCASCATCPIAIAHCFDRLMLAIMKFRNHCEEIARRRCNGLLGVVCLPVLLQMHVRLLAARYDYMFLNNFLLAVLKCCNPCGRIAKRRVMSVSITTELIVLSLAVNDSTE